MSSSAPQPLLEFKNWSVRFQAETPEEVVAVDEIDFKLYPGQSMGLVGESGSGKSMTALSAIQLLPNAATSSGDIIWKGLESLPALGARELQKLRACQIGMIFQEPLSSLNPVMRCGKQTSEPIRIHLGLNAREAKTTAINWFARVGLRDPERVYRSYPHELSGGQRQRVMIAMALCTGPELLIADEPTTALDVTVQKGILELIQQLQAELNIAVLFISHDLGVIREITDQVLVMWQGKVVESGTVQRILDHPQHPYTRGLVACRPGIAGTRRRLPTVADYLEHPEAEMNGFLAALEQSSTEQKERQQYLDTAPVCLEVNNLYVRYPKQKNWLGQVTAYHQAVADVSLLIKKGECLGVVGESGSGKTTLGKAIVRLVSIQQGQIFYQGEEVGELPESHFRAFRPKIQMVFQDPFSSLNPKLRIRDLLLEPLQVHASHLIRDERDERVREVLRQVDLNDDVLDRFPKAFSGGQRQRIGIARALLFEPDLLICDESVSALDVSVQAQVLNLLKDLQEQYQFSLLFISHDLGVIRFIADQVLVMQEGRVVEHGSAEQIFHDPQQAYTQQLLQAILR